MTRRLALLIVMTLAGCSLGESPPQGQQFLLRVDGDASTATPRGTETVMVQAASVVAPYSQRNFVYRHEGNAFESDPYNGFLASPSPMITDATIQWLREHGPFASVVGEGLVLDARFRLQQVVECLYAEFLPGTSSAVVQVHYVLSDEQASPPTILLDRSFTATVPLADGKPGTIAEGMNAALVEVLTEATKAMSGPR